ncbi:hypothetical protein [Lactococcus raffinolactis]|uniref:hypothetical protein n=1 Tax=Pseudolactococcus raffinolactis TaxID=1366 RepID=UPI0034CFAA9B
MKFLKMRGKIADALVYIVPIVFIPILFGILIYNPLYLIIKINSWPVNKFYGLPFYLLTLICGIVMVFLALLIYKTKISIPQKTKLIGNIIYFEVIFIVVLLICLARSGVWFAPDSAILQQGVKTFIDSGTTTSVQDYLKINPNNIPNFFQLIIEAKIFKGIFSPDLSWLLFEAGYITIGLLFTKKIIKQLFGSKMALIYMIFSFPFPIFWCFTEAFWYGSAYNETICFCFLAIFSYYLIKAFESDNLPRKCLFYIFSSSSFALAAYVRTAASLLILAIIVFVIFFEKGSKNIIKQVVFIILIFIIPFVSVPRIANSVADSQHFFTVSMSQMENDKGAKTIYHYLNLGADWTDGTDKGFQPGPRGQWNRTNFPGTDKKSKDRALSEYKKLILNRRGIVNSIRFYYLKLVDLWTNSAGIGWGGLSNKSNKQLKEDMKTERQTVYKTATYQNRLFDKIRHNLTNGPAILSKIINCFSWTFTLIGFMGAVVFFKRTKKNPLGLFFLVSVTMITGYLMLMESYMRFLLPFSTLIIIASCFGMKEIFEFILYKKCNRK